MQKKNLFIKTFGCQMNEYDSEKIADLLGVSCNLTLTTDPSYADLIILNSCSIRAKATDKLFSEIGRLRLLKKHKPELIIAIGGCVSMQEKENIFLRAPYVNIVFGPQTIHRLPEMYARALRQEKRIIDTTYCKIEKFDYFPKPVPKQQATDASRYISIMEGCNKFCSYCIVPYTRGIEASRNMADILIEIKQLAALHTKEIHLLGQNVNAYQDPVNKTNFAELLYEIATINTIERIRFTTSHPKEFSNDLINAFKNIPQLANHIHLPIQSGSNRILKLMRRGYDIETYQNIITKLREVRPNISISTDIIVGFPTETDTDFIDTMKIIENINFDASFSFIYSPRPNTPAAKMLDDVRPEVKKNRLQTLQNQLNKQVRNHNKNMLNTIQKVLVTEHTKENQKHFSGRTENNRIVNFNASSNLLGTIVKVKITESLANSLRGELEDN